jgi:hypothetical protein
MSLLEMLLISPWLMLSGQLYASLIPPLALLGNTMASHMQKIIGQRVGKCFTALIQQ